MDDQFAPPSVRVISHENWAPAPAPPIGGPEITCVFVCERLITDADGVNTAIRIAEAATMRYQVPTPLPEAEAIAFIEQAPPLESSLPLTLFVQVKGAVSSDAHTFGVVMNQVDGIREPMGLIQFTMPSIPAGGDYVIGDVVGGTNFVIPLRFNSKSPEGLLWFEFYIDDAYAGRLPFELIQYVSLWGPRPADADPTKARSETPNQSHPGPGGSGG